MHQFPMLCRMRIVAKMRTPVLVIDRLRTFAYGIALNTARHFLDAGMRTVVPVSLDVLYSVGHA